MFCFCFQSTLIRIMKVSALFLPISLGNISIFLFEIIFFSLFLVPPEIRNFWVLSRLIWCSERNRKDCLQVCAGILIFWGLLEKKNPRQNLVASLWHGFPGLERLFHSSVWDSLWKVATPNLKESIWSITLMKIIGPSLLKSDFFKQILNLAIFC